GINYGFWRSAASFAVTIGNAPQAERGCQRRRNRPPIVLLKLAPVRFIVRLRCGRSPEEAMFKGSLVALITPFRNGAVDETAFQEHVAWQIGQGTHGLVPIGTTGECPALEETEQERLIKLCVEV